MLRLLLLAAALVAAAAADAPAPALKTLRLEARLNQAAEDTLKSRK